MEMKQDFDDDKQTSCNRETRIHVDEADPISVVIVPHGPHGPNPATTLYNLGENRESNKKNYRRGKETGRTKTMFEPKEIIVGFTGSRMREMVRTEPVGQPFDYHTSTNRNTFVRTVLLLVLIMLSVTSITAVSFFHIGFFYRFFLSKAGMIAVIVAVFFKMIIMYSIMCFDCARKMCPGAILLFILSLCTSVIVAFTSFRIKTYLVIVAVVITAALVFICLGLSFTRFDFTKLYAAMVLLGLVVALFILAVTIMSFVLKFKVAWVYLGALFFATLLNCGILIAEMQMVFGGRSIELGEEDFVMGAMMIFESIIQILLDLMRMMHVLDGLFDD